MFQPKELDNSGGLGSTLSETLEMNIGNYGHSTSPKKMTYLLEVMQIFIQACHRAKSMKLSLYIQKDDLLSYVAD